jgi:polyisoprenoid-binding protein YceI
VPPGTAAPTTTAPPPATTFGPIPSGAWNIDQEGTVVGYRIAEELASIGGATAVGRTSEVTGTLVLDGAAITEVSVAVDMTSLASNDNRRDRQLRTRGLQTDQFPEATFMLDEPIDLGTVPAVGVPISATANGTLTLHGVSQSVTIVLDAQLLDATTIVVVGSTEVVLADYDIEPPVGFGVVSVADSGLFEFQLTFEA